ncbi:hypothetical protein [Ktedonospora formicarum]|uniref:hypothetical protein n=1 Tax=Ktedonospora formicarum TaxID=2778364 RepID=UPI001C693520|nr:hypothetical protein [Ktedonospora formicarum]
MSDHHMLSLLLLSIAVAKSELKSMPRLLKHGTMYQMDLWADIEIDNTNKDVLAQTNGSKPQKRVRRPSEREILAALRHWLLHDYVAAYCRTLASTRIFRRCSWIDALGLNAREQALVALPDSANGNGSANKKRRKKDVEISQVPLALRPLAILAHDLVQEQPPFSLQSFLLSGVRQSGSFQKEMALKEGGVLRSNWLESGPVLLNEVEPSPAIFLFNPFLPGLFGYDNLLKVYQRTAPTEILFWLPHRSIDACLQSAQSDEQIALRLKSLLRTDRWKMLPTDEANQARARQGFIDLFILSIKRHFSLPVQSIRLPVQIGPAWIETVPYTLLFATRRQDSTQCMNEALCSYRHRLYKHSHQGVLAEEWFLAQEDERRSRALEQLTQRILQLGREQRVRRWPDLRQQVMVERFGQFALTDYDQVMGQLLLEGEVRCERRRREVALEEAPIPGNDDILIWR